MCPRAPRSQASPFCSQTGEHLVFRPLLYICSAENKEEDQPGEVDGSWEEEDISPARFCILQAGNYRLLTAFESPSFWVQKGSGICPPAPPQLHSRLCGDSGCPWDNLGQAGTSAVPAVPSAGASHWVLPGLPDLKRNLTPLMGSISFSFFILLTVTTPYCTVHITNFTPILSVSFLQSRLQRMGSFVTFTECGIDAYLQNERTNEWMTRETRSAWGFPFKQPFPDNLFLRGWKGTEASNDKERDVQIIPFLVSLPLPDLLVENHRDLEECECPIRLSSAADSEEVLRHHMNWFWVSNVSPRMGDCSSVNAARKQGQSGDLCRDAVAARKVAAAQPLAHSLCEHSLGSYTGRPPLSIFLGTFQVSGNPPRARANQSGRPLSTRDVRCHCRTRKTRCSPSSHPRCGGARAFQHQAEPHGGRNK